MQKALHQPKTIPRIALHDKNSSSSTARGPIAPVKTKAVKTAFSGAENVSAAGTLCACTVFGEIKDTVAVSQFVVLIAQCTQLQLQYLKCGVLCKFLLLQSHNREQCSAQCGLKIVKRGPYQHHMYLLPPTSCALEFRTTPSSFLSPYPISLRVCLMQRRRSKLAVPGPRGQSAA